MTSRKSWLRAGIIAGAIIGPPIGGPAIGHAEEPLLVTYGVAAPTREGDQDHREVIFSVCPPVTSRFSTFACSIPMSAAATIWSMA